MVDRSWDVKGTNDPFVVPSFETVSFSLPTMGQWESLLQGKEDGWVYLSDGNPSLASLEKLLAQTQGVESCWVTSTGKSAIASILLALLKKTDHVILLREGYKSTRLFVQGTLGGFGVTNTLVGIDELSELEKHIQPGVTKLIILESPTNPMVRVPDLQACLSVAQKHNVTTVLDNSMGGFHQHGDLGFDVIVHSLSKYAGGVGAVMGGAVMGSKTRVAQIKNANVWNTDVLSTHAAIELWKGMQTYELRISRQSSNAMAIAQYLEGSQHVSRVLYPGLPSHPDYKVAKKQMNDYGSVLAFDVAGGPEAMRALLDNLNVFRIAFGTGFTQSIASPAWLFYARSFPEAQTGISAIHNNTVRLSIGVEPVETLLADFEQAFAKSPQLEFAAK
jgi:cystathionine beta-lyase/cystathionine gamma-synthase